MATGIPLSEVGLPTFVKGLTTLGGLLKTAIEHAQANGVDPNTYAEASIAPDMKNLIFQVQVATNTAKKSVWRLTGIEQESWADDEKTMVQLQERVQKCIDLLNKAETDKIQPEGLTTVKLEMGASGSMTLPAKAYLLDYGHPNFFFHLSMAYAILRMKGVPLGKSHYLGAFLKNSGEGSLVRNNT